MTKPNLPRVGSLIEARVPHEGDSRKIRAKYFGILGFSKKDMSFVGFLLEN